MRKWLATIAVLALITGCSKAPAPGPDTPPDPPLFAPPVQPAPVAQNECRPEPRDGTGRIDFVVDGKAIGSLPAKDCTVTAVAGANLILHIYPSKGIGKPILTDAGETLWNWNPDHAMIPAFGVQPGGRRELKLDLKEQGMGEFTYTFVAREATTYTVESGPARTGPWTKVGETGFISPQHGWLKLSYSGPMSKSDGPAVGTREPHDLPVEWEGDRTAYLNLSAAPVVFALSGGRDAEGFLAHGPAPVHAYYYRSEAPQLARVTTDGKVTPVYALKGIPEWMNAHDGKLTYQLSQSSGSFVVDVMTGAETAVGSRIDGAHGFGETWIQSAATGWYADLALPGGPDVREDRFDMAALVISDQSHKEMERVENFIRLHRIVPGCTVGGPSMAWRPDGGALAAISAPEKGKLDLVIYDLATKQRRVLASRPGDPSGVYGGLTWAPGGRYITFGQHLVDIRNGRFVTDGLSRDVRWNPAGTHLLEKRHNPFVRWQEMAIIEAETGKRTSLGYGDILGWTAAGEALVIKWDASRHIPAPGKGCLP